MRRIGLWFASTVSVLVLLFGYHTSTSGPSQATSQLPVVSGTASSPSTSSGRSGAGSSTSGSGSGKVPSTTTVTGVIASTQWGPVQVQLVLDGRAITRVNVIQYPSGDPKDAEINGYALPILIQETTAAQDASIDMVSGATVTSTGYIQSLQSALDQAGL